jgi:hypothetical protein
MASKEAFVMPRSNQNRARLQRRKWNVIRDP